MREGREQQTMGTVNSMLLCPLQIQTSPKRTSVREMLPNTEVAVITNAVTASAAGRVTFQRHTVPVSGRIYCSDTESCPTIDLQLYAVYVPGVTVAVILTELKATSTALQPST